MHGEIVMTIDDPTVIFTEIVCPNNPEHKLEYYPTQSGPCHSGLFVARMNETYWCVECEQNFEPNLIDNKTQ